MKARPRVLLVTPVFTHPPVQGDAARILAFGRELRRRGFAVHVLHYVLDALTAEGDAAMRKEWDSVVNVEARPHARARYASHWGIDDFCHEAVCDEVRRLCREVGYCAVVTHYVWMSRALIAVEAAVKIIDTIDIFAGRHELALQSGLQPNWYFTDETEENAGYDRADLVIGIQDVETAKMSPRTRASTMTVGHPIDPWFITNADSPHKVTRFGYFGSGNPWNVRSVAALDAAMPQGERFDWSLAGSVCRAPLHLASRPFHFGFVDAPEDFYRFVECVINPEIGGTGLKTKTIEALAHGRAVIGTRRAFEGMNAVHPFHSFDAVQDVVEGMRVYDREASARSDVQGASRQLYFNYMDIVRQHYDDLAHFIQERS